MSEEEVVKLMREVEAKRPNEFNRVIGMMQGILIAQKGDGVKNEINRCS